MEARHGKPHPNQAPIHGCNVTLRLCLVCTLPLPLPRIRNLPHALSACWLAKPRRLLAGCETASLKPRAQGSSTSPPLRGASALSCPAPAVVAASLLDDNSNVVRLGLLADATLAVHGRCATNRERERERESFTPSLTIRVPASSPTSPILSIGRQTPASSASPSSSPIPALHATEPFKSPVPSRRPRKPELKSGAGVGIAGLDSS